MNKEEERCIMLIDELFGDSSSKWTKNDILKKYIDLLEYPFTSSIFTIISFISDNRRYIRPLILSLDDFSREDFKVKIDEFDEENPYVEILLSNELKYTKIDMFPVKSSVKQKLNEKNMREIIISPIESNNTVLGFISVFFSSENLHQNLNYLFDYCKTISTLISDTMMAWCREIFLGLEKQKADLIVELSNLSLQTTKIKVILKSILKKIRERYNIEQIGFFRRELDKFKLYEGVNIDKEVDHFFESKDLQIEAFPYFNTASLIENQMPGNKGQYAIILPVGSTNLMFGFLLVISPPKKKLNEDTISFLRLIANQLFLILQRRILLEDIQAITQTSELSFFPVLIIDKELQIIYSNNQFEKLFNVKSEDILGTKVKKAISIKGSKYEELKAITKEVLENLSKRSIRLDIKLLKAGKENIRTFFIYLTPTINNLTGEYCVVLSLIDISEAAKLQELAEEYTTRSKMYLNVLTHDIFNILFAIGGYYEFMKEFIPNEQMKNLEKISNLVHRGTEIVNDMRLLSKVLDSSTKANKTLLPLRTILSTTIEDVKRRESEKNLQIFNEIPSSVKIKGGEFVSKIFEYLLLNTLRETQYDTVEIYFRGEFSAEKKEELFILDIEFKDSISSHFQREMENMISKTSIGDETKKKLLWVEIIKEIAKRNDYQITVKSFKIEGNRTRIIYRLLMPVG